MFYFLSLFAGLLITALIASNGGLSAHYGIYTASVIIHIVGLIAMTIVLLIRRESPFAHTAAWILYIGGGIGVLTTLFNNFAFGFITVSALLALNLLGQSVTGLLVDQFGLMGMVKHPFHVRKLAGLALVVAGIIVMIDTFILIPVLISFAAGICIVLSRTINAKLSEKSSVYVSTFYNYVVGLSLSLVALLILGQGELGTLSQLSLSLDPLIYLGGLFGAAVVLISNITVMKVSAFYLTLLMFVGQIFSAIIFDMAISQTFEPLLLAGGALVALGLIVDLLIDRKYRPQDLPTN
ncbi:MAG: DMT family transporter [Coriobacteriia bacterium]|nr:DMT family transporter [Coriobacteriia bacterium]MCL2870523.1 DMT family transporter [Coriobacteriia bacterium]